MILEDLKRTYFLARPCKPVIRLLLHQSKWIDNDDDIYLKCKESEDHKTEDCKCHDFSKLFKRMKKSVDDSLESWQYRYCFQGPENSKSSQTSQISNI